MSVHPGPELCVVTDTTCQKKKGGERMSTQEALTRMKGGVETHCTRTIMYFTGTCIGWTHTCTCTLYTHSMEQ